MKKIVSMLWSKNWFKAILNYSKIPKTKSKKAPILHLYRGVYGDLDSYLLEVSSKNVKGICLENEKYFCCSTFLFLINLILKSVSLFHILWESSFSFYFKVQATLFYLISYIQVFTTFQSSNFNHCVIFVNI